MLHMPIIHLAIHKSRLNYVHVVCCVRKCVNAAIVLWTFNYTSGPIFPGPLTYHVLAIVALQLSSVSFPMNTLY